MRIEYEPFSERSRLDPFPLYRQLREHAPVHWAPGAKAFVVSRYDDVEAVLKQPELFSSDAMGGMLVGQAPTSAAANDESRARILILMDPPRHGSLRNLVNRGFTPRRIAVLERRLREIVEDAMKAARGANRFDVVADVAIPVPIRIIAELLGVETERIDDFRRWSDAIIAGTTGSARKTDLFGDPAFQQAVGDLFGYLDGIIEQRRARPREDLISTLIQGGDGEVGLTRQEIGGFALVLLIAGNETTTNLIGSMVRLLLENPAQLELVAKDRSLVPNLIEEALRFESPVQFLYRRAREPVEIAGTRIPRDAAVIPLLGSANRDERHFERPDEFDLTREPRPHLAFGFGVHFCLGASLARLEARVTMEALLDELPRFETVPGGVQLADSFMLRGPRRLELERTA